MRRLFWCTVNNLSAFTHCFTSSDSSLHWWCPEAEPVWARIANSVKLLLKVKSGQRSWERYQTRWWVCIYTNDPLSNHEQTRSKKKTFPGAVLTQLGFGTISPPESVCLWNQWFGAMFVHMQSTNTLDFVCIYYFPGKQQGALYLFGRSPNVLSVLYCTCGNYCGCFHLELDLLRPHTCPPEAKLIEGVIACVF